MNRAVVVMVSTLYLALWCCSLVEAVAVPGDFNDDGIVDLTDYAHLANCFAGPQLAPTPQCAVCDLDDDGDVDLADFARMTELWLAMDCDADATASSVEYGDPQYGPSMAIDGLLGTRWSSEWADNQWLEVDFGRDRDIFGLKIHWEWAYAKAYSIKLSQNDSAWTAVYSTSISDGDLDDISFSPRTARYLRIECVSRATQYGNSIWEVILKSNDNCYIEEITDVEAYIEGLIQQMTLEEKTTLCYGQSYMELHAVPRLGIPSLRLADGPLGIREGEATAFPASIALASTWDVDLLRETGVAFGKEWRNKGRHMVLGPCMNIVRVPHGGRNFETYGEDPFLNSRMAVAMISGIQSQDVMACAKHYACNNQEFDRFTINIQVQERAFREIYLPAFKASVMEAGVWGVMSAYNRLNGPYATANGYLQREILKDEWGFQGFVVSDWGAVHETVGSANAGLDLEMDAASPVGAYWGNSQLLQAVQNGQVAEEVVDDKVRRVLRAIYSSGITEIPGDGPDQEIIEHRELVRRAGASGIVLLKNEGQLLPLNKTATQTIALIGPNYEECRTGGGGSSYVTPYYSVAPLEGIQDAVSGNVTLLEAVGVYQDSTPPPVHTSWFIPPSGSGNGLQGEYYANTSLAGSPALTRTDATINFDWGEGSPGSGIGTDGFSVRWSGSMHVPVTGEYSLGMTNDDGARVYLNGQLLIDDWNDHGTELHQVSVQLTAGTNYDVIVEYYENGGSAVAKFSCFRTAAAFDEAVAAAVAADIAVVFVGLNSAVESEGYDRSTMDIPVEQVDLINAVASANPNTVVVVIAGSQVGMDSWIDNVPCMVQAWYLGQEGGNAIADVLFGDVNPSGKLPFSFIRHWEDHFAHDNYPGNVYTEGIFVGYRYYDEAGVAPLYPFGFGLSYTTFALSNLVVDSSDFAGEGTISVSVDVANTGTRAGAEVVQVYVQDVAASVPRPVRELKGFAKVSLAPGETKTVEITLTESAFAFYDVPNGRWYTEPGQFIIHVGNSSRSLPLSAGLTLP